MTGCGCSSRNLHRGRAVDSVCGGVVGAGQQRPRPAAQARERLSRRLPFTCGRRPIRRHLVMGAPAWHVVTRYDLAERAAGFFRFFAAPAPGFTERATFVVAAGLAAGEDPQEAVQAARTLHGYEIAFWGCACRRS
jgi:hypothetical protein